MRVLRNQRPATGANPFQSKTGSETVRLRRINANELALSAFFFKLYDPSYHREERVVRAPPYVMARLKLGASLANQYFAAQHRLTSKSFHSEPL
jgi:hypothetical protein